MSPESTTPTPPTRLHIHLNGEPRETAAGTTVSALLTELGYTNGAVAVERNREVVLRRDHTTTELVSGDELEVVTFVGGG